MIYIHDELFSSKLNNLFRHYVIDIDAALATTFDDFRMDSADKKHHNLFYPLSVFSYSLNIVTDDKYLDYESKYKLLNGIYDDISITIKMLRPLIRRNPMRQVAASLSLLFIEFFMAYFRDTEGKVETNNEQYKALIDLAGITKCDFDIISEKQFLIHMIIFDLIMDIENYAKINLKNKYDYCG